jgi:long-subunit fatty acid transport protein
VSSDVKLKDMAFGLGIYSPFGIGGMKWSDTGLTRYAATDTLIGTFAIHPAFAWKVKPWLSIGGGVYYMRAMTDLERMVDQSALEASDGKLHLKGDGGGWGYNPGVLLFPGEKLSLGFVYRSHSTVGQDMTFAFEDIAPRLQPFIGGATFETDASSSVDFPRP